MDEGHDATHHPQLWLWLWRGVVWLGPWDRVPILGVFLRWDVELKALRTAEGIYAVLLKSRPHPTHTPG